MSADANIRIAIIFIGLGKYIKFWNEFYETINKHFCVEADKHFFAFSDGDPDLFVKNNVTYINWEKRGWPHDSECRFKCMLCLSQDLEQYDYVCFANSNLRCTRDISVADILPKFGYQSWTCMLHPAWAKRPKDKLPVDDEPTSAAYMKPEECKQYLQAAFYLATPYAMLDMAHQCQKMLDINTRNEYTAKWHDESYFNKYIVHRPKRLLGADMITAEIFVRGKTPPMVLLNKKRFCNSIAALRS